VPREAAAALREETATKAGRRNKERATTSHKEQLGRGAREDERTEGWMTQGKDKFCCSSRTPRQRGNKTAPLN